MAFYKQPAFLKLRAALYLTVITLVTLAYLYILYNTLAGRNRAYVNPFLEDTFLGYPVTDSVAFVTIATCLMAGGLLFLLSFASHRANFHRMVWLPLLLALILLSASLIMTSLVWDFIVFCALMVAALPMAYRLLALLKIEFEAGAERLAFAISLALSTYILLALILGIAGLLLQTVILGLVVITALLFWKEFITFYRDVQRVLRAIGAIEKGNPWLIPIVWISLAALLLGFTEAITPESQYDAAHIHLYLADIYAEQGKLVEVVSTSASYRPKGAVLLFTLGYLFDDQVIAKLFSWFPSVIFALLLPSFTRRFFGERSIGLLAFAIFMTTPLVGWASGTAYVESLSTFFLFMTIYGFMGWREHRETGWAILTGWFAGMAFFSKLQNANTLIILAALIAWALLPRIKHIKAAVVQGMAFLVPFAVIILPWQGLVYAWTGNPLFPFYNNIFRSPYAPQDTGSSVLQSGGEGSILNTFGREDGIRGLLLLPYNLTFHSGSFIEPVNGNYLVGLLLILLPFWLLAPHAKASWGKILILFAICLGTMMVWFLQAQYLRYLIYIFPVCAILTAYFFYQSVTTLAVTKSAFSGMVYYLLYTVLAIGFVLTIRAWWNVPYNIPIKYLTGQQDRLEYQLTGGYRADTHVLEYVRSQHPDGHIIVVENFYSLGLYGEASHIFHLRHNPAMENFLAENSAHPEAIASVFDYLGVSYFIRSTAPSRHKLLLPDAFIDQYLVLVYTYPPIEAYLYLPDGRGSITFASVLLNGDFGSSADTALENWRFDGSPMSQCEPAPAQDCFALVSRTNPVAQTIRMNQDSIYLVAFYSRDHDLATPTAANLAISWLDDQGNIERSENRTFEAVSEWGYAGMFISSHQSRALSVKISSTDETVVEIDEVAVVQVRDFSTTSDPDSSKHIFQKWKRLIDCLVLDNADPFACERE